MSAMKSVVRDNYDMMLLKDYLKEQIKDSGFAKAEVSKTPVGTRVSLHVTRPGIVIGRNGVGIRALTERLGTDFGLKNPQVTVIEVEKPELSPGVMCNRMASHMERGTAFRRATMWTIQQIMEGGAMGVQITVSGKLRGDRSAFEKHTAGILPRAGHHADVIVSDDVAHVKTAMGLVGIRIRIAMKDRYVPEFELRDKGKAAVAAAPAPRPGPDLKEMTEKAPAPAAVPVSLSAAPRPEPDLKEMTERTAGGDEAAPEAPAGESSAGATAEAAAPEAPAGESSAEATAEAAPPADATAGAAAPEAPAGESSAEATAEAAPPADATAGAAAPEAPAGESSAEATAEADATAEAAAPDAPAKEKGTGDAEDGGGAR